MQTNYKNKIKTCCAQTTYVRKKTESKQQLVNSTQVGEKEEAKTVTGVSRLLDLAPKLQTVRVIIAVQKNKNEEPVQFSFPRKNRYQVYRAVVKFPKL